MCFSNCRGRRIFYNETLSPWFPSGTLQKTTTVETIFALQMRRDSSFTTCSMIGTHHPQKSWKSERAVSNWNRRYSSYSLLARQEHQYGAELNALRYRMMDQANLSHVEKLHHIGRQLAVLKRLYQSYELIIDRVLEKQKSGDPVAHAYSVPISASSSLNGFELHSSHEAMGIFLTSGVRVRFERLRDRIRLYALSEIQECIDMKESLVSMNFSLIAMKESDSVERLTRITILLAKVTILFLPVSLMTNYFSTQIRANFTVAAYWTSFAVVFTVTFLTLFVFGKISGTLEGKMVYRSLGQALYDTLGKMLGRRK